MFDWLHKKKKEKKEEVIDELLENRPQEAKDGIYLGMYCKECGYMEVDEQTSILPLEGFAVCPNCGALLKAGHFVKVNDGYALAENAVHILRKVQTGGHHRVRRPGPAITRSKGDGRIVKR